MMQLKDLLTNEGFSTVALPSDDIESLQMLLQTSDGVLSRLGNGDKIKKLFKVDPSQPSVVVNLDATLPDITGSVCLSSEAKTSFGLMESLSKKIGVSLGFALDKSDDDQLVFMFESPKKDGIDSWVDLENYMNNSELVQTSYSDKLKDNEIYIITAVLKSKNFAVGLVHKDNLGAALILPTIKSFVEGNITFGKGSDKQRVYQYKGEKDLVFGIQAAQVRYDRTLWQTIAGQKGVFSVTHTEGVLMRSFEDIKVTLLTGQNLKI